MRVWAAIDLLAGAAVTLKQGRAEERKVWSDDPLMLAKKWEDEGADGLHLIDLDAALERGSNREIVSRIVRSARIPVQVGGGVRNLEIAREWLDMGAERIVVGTMAYTRPELLAELLRDGNSRRVVVAADYKDGTIVTNGWAERRGIPLLDAVRELRNKGVTNLLATCVGRDGMGLGPDVAGLREICGATKMSVIASGGVRDAQDVRELEESGADGVILGRALYEGSVRISDTRRQRVRL